MRNFNTVVDHMLEHVPPDEVYLRAALEKNKYKAQFLAPEVIQVIWVETMDVLKDFCAQRRQPGTIGTPWEEAVLQIWRGER